MSREVRDERLCLLVQFEVGLGYGGGRYLNTSWTTEYFYKANRIGTFYDKLAKYDLKPKDFR